MASRGVLKSVLWSFLGTYTSRYTDYQGYWLFGFLVNDLTTIEVDLLGSGDRSPETPSGMARRAAVRKFADQIKKAGLDMSQVREARLTVERLPGEAVAFIKGHDRNGALVRFAVTVTADNGRRFAREQTLVVAPHDARIESRSTKSETPT
jgi:hypothetical protein